MKETPEQVHEVRSVPSFLGFIYKGMPDVDRYIYRGQPAKYMTRDGLEFNTILTPSLYRQTLCPENGGDVGDLESKLLDDFQRESIPYLKREVSTKIERMALAQHYRLPTRLLDWTFNPLVALFFAVEDDRLGYDAHVYQGRVFDLQIYDKNHEVEVTEDEVFCLYVPPNFDGRIQAQSSCFTVHPRMQFSDRSRILTLFGEQTINKLSASRCVIPNVKFRDIKKELNMLGVTYKFLFPGLEGLCRSITWSNTGDSLFLQRLGILMHEAEGRHGLQL